MSNDGDLIVALKHNILANYVSQFYVTLVGILTVPFYIKYMGAEAYGLVGFFAMLQAWFTLLDMGLTPTMARETARFSGGATDALQYRRLVRTLEGIFLFIALVGGLALFLLSGQVANDWLQANHLPISEIEFSIQIMAIIVAMRWMGGLYRGAISGSERLVWLGSFNLGIATLRFLGVMPILIYVDSSPSTFFNYQLAVAAIELVGLTLKAYSLLPGLKNNRKVKWAWAPLRPVLKFSLTIAFTSSVCVLIMQTDKLVLSKILPLAEYGYFTLAVLVASGIMVVSGPVGAAIMPRMANMEAKGDHAGLIRLYRQTTQLVAVLAGAVAVTVAFCAEPLLWAWTGDAAMAKEVAPVLKLYALGNGILTVAAFPYYLQYAKGDLRLHLIGNLVFVVLLIPIIILVSSRFGGIGAGYVWLGMNLLSFFAWIPLVHRKFEPGLNLSWYGRDILLIVGPAIIMALGLSNFLQINDNRWAKFAEIMVVGMLVLLTAAVASSEMRVRAYGWIKLHSKERKEGA